MLGRQQSSISYEVNKHGGPFAYDAVKSHVETKGTAVAAPLTKVCRSCGNTRNIKEFSKRAGPEKGIERDTCRSCAYAESGGPYSLSPEYRKAYMESRGKWARMVREYGLSQEEYEAFLSIQGNACAGCGTMFKDSSDIRIDHQHIDGGKVRGLLCHNCNVSLGLLKDSPETLRALADYLERNQRG